MLDVALKLEDLEAMEPEYYKSLKWILENDITDVIDEKFCAETDFFGRKDIVDLKPGGSDITVRFETCMQPTGTRCRELAGNSKRCQPDDTRSARRCSLGMSLTGHVADWCLAASDIVTYVAPLWGDSP